jgi:hypothetical protein
MIKCVVFALLFMVICGHALGQDVSISYSSGISDGDQITITTDGTYDFGANGPSVLYYMSLSGVSDGDTLGTDNQYGYASVSAGPYGAPTIGSASGLPYGLGIEIGDYEAESSENSTITKTIDIVSDSVYTQFFEFYYFQYPAENQSAASSFDKTGWQVKPAWHYAGESAGHDQEPDVFVHSWQWYAPGSYWISAPNISSNDQPISQFDTSSNQLRNPSDATLIRSDAINRQFWVKCGPVAGSATGSDGFVQNMSSSSGIIKSTDYNSSGYWTGNSATIIGYDRVNLPGYVRGFHVPDSCHWYISQYYCSTGPGAAARVEITDSQVYENSTQTSICIVSSWSATSITADISHGVFYASGVEQMYVHVFDENNDHVVMAGQIVGPETSISAPTSLSARKL